MLCGEPPLWQAEKLRTLPDEKRAEVFDFVDDPAARFAGQRASPGGALDGSGFCAD
jgi:hypothetical protein